MHVRRVSIVLLALTALAPLVSAVAARGPSPTCPTFDTGNFHNPTAVKNPYFPLTAGDLYTYKGTIKKLPEVEKVYVTHNTPTKDGISVVEVRDREKDGGVLVEDTRDWFAQDDDGNVWYMGEFTTQLPDMTHDGSWTAGVDGAQPGSIMEASPQVGDTYCQEHAPAIAEDAGQVVSVTASRSVPYGDFSGDVLQTRDFSLIEPHSEYKYYAPGVGMIEAIALNGGSEDIQLSSLLHDQ